MGGAPGPGEGDDGPQTLNSLPNATGHGLPIPSRRAEQATQHPSTPQTPNERARLLGSDRRSSHGRPFLDVALSRPASTQPLLPLVTYDDFNRFCEALPATNYVMQWGGSHVWKVGTKVFAIGGWADEAPAFTFKVDAIAFDVLSTQPGLRPAPYFASRGMKWIQCYAKPGPSDAQLEALLRESYRIVALGLTKKSRRELGLD